MPGVPPARFGYLGPAGTFTEAALRTLPAAGRADLHPYASVAAALEAVRAGDTDGAMVPLENSVEGSVATTLDELASGDPLQITREVLLPVRFALLARRGTGLHEVRTVATHPHAEAQCRRWLREVLPEASVVLAPSTADAAREVAAGRHDAALAAPVAAAHYGLTALADDVHDRDDAVTRFVLVSRPGPPPAPTGADRTTLFAYISDDRPGALLELLTEFAVRGVNLTRIESRPTGDRLGRYFFSVDCEGHLADARVGEALSALHRVCADVRVLGSYPRADGVPPVVRDGTSDADFRASAAWLTRLRDGT
ncbi:MAG TPA: prephenate dehydratase [Mycobacteriales bacterium]|nr:prephenate dehydratase [Mycobacteriales bacterium]